MVDAPTLNYDVISEHREEYGPQCLQLSAASGWAHVDLSKWSNLLRGCSDLFVAKRSDGSFAGCLLRTSWATVGGGPGPKAFDMFGMMLVDPANQRQGIATRLLSEFEAVAALHKHVCGLGVATEEGRAVYEKRGYRSRSEGSTCCRLLAPGTIAGALPCEALKVTIARASERPAALERLLALDRIATGLDRAHQLTCLAGLEGSFVALASDGAGVAGALLGIVDSQTGALCIGPLLGTEAVAMTLLACIGRDMPESSIAIFVLDHVKLVESLQASGFSMAGSAITGTMLLGDAPIPGDRARYIAIIHPCFG